MKRKKTIRRKKQFDYQLHNKIDLNLLYN